MDTIRALSIKAPGVDTPVSQLSGGNQQKVVIGRWLQRRRMFSFSMNRHEAWTLARVLKFTG